MTRGPTAPGRRFSAPETRATTCTWSWKANVRIVSNGRELELLGPGGVFGEIALIDNGPRSADAVAATDCRVVPIDENWFKFLVQQTPFFSLQIMRVMADRLRRANQNA